MPEPTIIAAIVAGASVSGIAWIGARHIPALKKVSPEETSLGVAETAEKLKNLLFHSRIGKPFANPEVFLQKVLSTIRVLALRTEQTTAKRLEHLRKQAQEKKQKFSKSYWSNLKKSPKKKAGGEKAA